VNNRLTKTAVLAVAALALTGCSQHPGSAAVIGSHSISIAQVDDVARGLCSANTHGGSGVTNLPSRGARVAALAVMLDSELSREFGAAKHVRPDEEQVSKVQAAQEVNVRLLPASEQPPMRAWLKTYAEGQQMLQTIGKASLRSQGQTKITSTQAIAEGSRLRKIFAKHITISIDPRFGVWSNGTVRFTSGSVSVAQSARAVLGDKADPSSVWSATLPPSQTCG
jgi:hypothetical protein